MLVRARSGAAHARHRRLPRILARARMRLHALLPRSSHPTPRDQAVMYDPYAHNDDDGKDRDDGASLPSGTPDWRCTFPRDHGPCGAVNDASDKSCGACGEDRPPSPTTPPSPEEQGMEMWHATHPTTPAPPTYPPDCLGCGTRYIDHGEPGL